MAAEAAIAMKTNVEAESKPVLKRQKGGEKGGRSDRLVLGGGRYRKGVFDNIDDDRGSPGLFEAHQAQVSYPSN